MNNSNQDPWTWGEEDNGLEDSQRHDITKNRWNTSTSVTTDPKRTKDITNEFTHTSNSGSDYFDTINVRNMSHQVPPNWTQSGDLSRNSINFPPQSSTANYFNNNNNKSNNNGQTDVENKEVAPPDNQFNRSSRQPPLFKDNQRGRHIQEQKTFSSQINQNTSITGNSGMQLSSAASFFDTNQQIQQENTFQNPSVNTYYTNQNTYSGPSNTSAITHSSVYFTPQTNETDNIATKQNIQTSDIHSQKQIDSNNSVSSHFTQSSMGELLLPSTHISSDNSFPPKSNNPPFFPAERSNISSTIFPPTNQSTVPFSDGLSETKTVSSHQESYSNSSEADKSKVNASGSEMPLSQIPSSSSSAAAGGHFNQNSLYSKQQENDGTNLITSSLQSSEHMHSFVSTFTSSNQPPVSNQGTISQPPPASSHIVPQQPTAATFYQQPFNDSQQNSQHPLVSNQNSNVSLVSNPTSLSNDSHSFHSFTSHYHMPPPPPQQTVPYQQQPFPYQPSVPSQQTTVSQQPPLPLKVTGSQQPSSLSTISQQSADSLAQHHSATIMSTTSYPPPNSQQQPDSFQSLPVPPQAPPQNSLASSLNTQVPPTNSYHSLPPQNSNASPFNTHAPPISHLPPNSYQSQPPQNSTAPPVNSQAPPISHSPPNSYQSQPPQNSQAPPPPISHPPLNSYQSQPPQNSTAPPISHSPLNSYQSQPPQNSQAPPPPIAHPPLNSYQSQPPQNSTAPPVNSQAPPISHSPPNSYQSQLSQNSQAPPPIAHPPLNSYQSQPPLNPNSPPINTQAPPISHPYQTPLSSLQSQLHQTPPVSQPLPMSQQPLVPQRTQQIPNQPPPTFNQTQQQQQSFPPSQPPISSQQPLSNQPSSAIYQPMTSQNYEGTLMSFSQTSFSQESTLNNSQKADLITTENQQNDTNAKELISIPSDVNPTGFSPANVNDVHNNAIDLENTNQVRYSPSPQLTSSHSRTPSDVPYSQNSQIPPSSSNVFSHNINAASENTYENDPNNYSRDQISFNFQNVQPIAASSPAPPASSIHNIPENQERLPEMPDNTETLLDDMKKLSINKEEVADTQTQCQVDRNQYLETGHLSGSKDHILTDNSPNVEAIDESEAPPPGLHRLVTGQGCEMTSGNNTLLMAGDSTEVLDTNRHSSPASSTAGSENRGSQREPVGESEAQVRSAGRLVQGQSIGDDTDGGVREVPGEATPFNNRIVLGQMGRSVTPPLLQDGNTTRGDNSREREIVGRMVAGERYDRDISQNVSNQDEFRQSHRSLRRSRRGESSYEDEDHDYSSDRDRRVDEYKRRGDDRDRVRHRSRREHRSPEYRSDEDFEDRRGFSRMGRSERRHRRYDHYREYDDEYYYRENRSRPSSRTGSDYRRTNIDYMSGRVPRHMFYPDMGAIPFNPRAPEEYYETMRRLDPMGYAAWYNQYMSSRYSQQAQASFSNDRASVHSGQSSTNNRPNVETPQAEVEDIGRDDEELVHASAHIKGIIDNQGRLIVIDPHYPTDNQRPTVNIYKITNLPTDPDIDEFLESPGPFVPGVTHRNTVLQYLKLISDRSTKSSEKLLYDLIHLSVKSNGELNGLDVADLLMESYKKSQLEDGANLFEVTQEQISTKDALNKFRELLQQGNKSEALEWAIDHGAWGHALFLASKMDERTHNNIMLRFANSIPHTDPLQTLYQLMSGHVPQASTCCADKKWSDWRPHLAMILGNPTGNPKLDRKAIIKLGDSLFAKGRIFASHFCYITAQVDFTSYSPDAKLVLLGANPNQKFSNFATCRAIMVTICYEYGLKLRQANANIPSLQFYKLILALRLIDNGKSRIALQYCELIANEALKSNCCERVLIATLIDLSSKLKMLDPTLTLTGDVESDPDWLSRLKTFYNNLSDDYDAGLVISHGVSTSSVSDIGQETVSTNDNVDNNIADINNYQNDTNLVSNNGMEFSILSVQQPTFQQQQQPPATVQPLLMPTSVSTELAPPEEPQQQQTYQHSIPTHAPPNAYNPADAFPQPSVQTAVDPYWTQNTETSSNTYTQQETVETTNVSNSKNNFFKASEEQLKVRTIKLIIIILGFY
ncbi:hypothetical protein O3M35_004725 [Rhynocoris fuscipes]|uniref:Sec16 Sec23-binding domain-containing protein n=1 Tax=Rhynocoris fuscipes TaxID=488301 RepID=A0AAW1CFI5_9HEMI